MLLELVAFYGIFVLILIFLAEWGQKRILGILASVLIIPLGIWILASPIQIKTGEIVTVTGDNLESIAGTNSMNGSLSGLETVADNDTTIAHTYIEDYNVSTASTVTMNETRTTAYVYSEASENHFNDLVGLVLVLLGIYGMAHYGLRSQAGGF